MTPRHALVGVCLVIAGLDLVQPVLLDWVPKHVGALLGGLFYLASAAGIARGIDAIAWGVAVLPVLPLGILVLWGAGVALPMTPDAPMVTILVLQLVAASLAVRILRARPRPSP